MEINQLHNYFSREIKPEHSLVDEQNEAVGSEQTNQKMTKVDKRSATCYVQFDGLQIWL